MEFSVLMSVYHKEKPAYLQAALHSVLVEQSVLPSEVVLIKDGALTSELDAVIDAFVGQFPAIIKVHALAENVGLGPALHYGVQQCQYELIARMDTDDISVATRFEKQLAYFKEHPEAQALGMWIAEFYDVPENRLFERQTPTTKAEILQFVKRRNPFNHMTMMFKKSAVLAVDNYQAMPFAEDYYLWIRLLGNQYEMANIGEVGVLARTGDDMYARRSDARVIKSWYALQKAMRQYRMITWYDVPLNMFYIVAMTYTPIWLKRIMYKRFLRK